MDNFVQVESACTFNDGWHSLIIKCASRFHPCKVIHTNAHYVFTHLYSYMCMSPCYSYFFTLNMMLETSKCQITIIFLFLLCFSANIVKVSTLSFQQVCIREFNNWFTVTVSEKHHFTCKKDLWVCLIHQLLYGQYDWNLLIFSDMSYGSRYTLDDVVQSMKKTGVGLKGKTC